ncbi:MAG: serine/threonine protein kinase [Xanthomonadales bacterium]|nr:serine/threonine protein kinase [Xanthomonadales bacterium]
MTAVAARAARSRAVPMPIRPEDLATGGALLGSVAASLLARSRSAEAPRPGQRLGPFRITGELGRGGMAIVFRGERDDGEYRQAVALKWIASGHQDEARRTLFLRERQALADLVHPNIAHLLDGGHTADGQPWLAMELIEGVRIDAHARDGALDLRQRLLLFLQVCSAVSHAHGHGFLHRDIKPSNVLVDGSGTVKLLDFGITHLVDGDDDLASSAHTPGYASPEQQRGERPTVAADIWQLGRLLQRLLATQDEPSTVTRSDAQAVAGRQDGTDRLPADLRALIACATADLPGQRYATVDALATDVRAFLDQRPLAAVGRRPGYRLRRFVGRNRSGVLVATGVLIVLALAAATSALRIRDERDLARAAAARAEREAATARAINQFLSEDLIRAADPYGVNAQDAPIGELIELAIPRVEPRLAGQPLIAAELYAVLGDTLLNLGRTEPAAQALDLAIARARPLLGANDPTVVRYRLRRADVEEVATRYDRHRTLLRELAADLEVLDARDPRRVEADRHLAWNAFLTGDFEAAAVAFAELAERAGPGPDQEAGVAALSRAYIAAGLGLALARLGRGEEALEAAEETRRLRGQALGAEHPDALAAGFPVATALIGVGRIDEAVALLADLDARFVARFGTGHPQAVLAAHELGVALARQHRYPEAIEPLRRAAEARLASFGADNGGTMNSMAALALVQARAGDIAAARETIGRIWSGGYQARTEYDRIAEAGLRRTMGEIALADDAPAQALLACDQAAALLAGRLPEGHSVHLQVEACRLLARWRLAPGDAGLRQSLATLADALVAHPGGDWWQRLIVATLGAGN